MRFGQDMDITTRKRRWSFLLHHHILPLLENFVLRARFESHPHKKRIINLRALSLYLSANFSSHHSTNSRVHFEIHDVLAW